MIFRSVWNIFWACTDIFWALWCVTHQELAAAGTTCEGTHILEVRHVADTTTATVSCRHSTNTMTATNATTSTTTTSPLHWLAGYVPGRPLRCGMRAAEAGRNGCCCA